MTVLGGAAETDLLHAVEEYHKYFQHAEELKAKQQCQHDHRYKEVIRVQYTEPRQLALQIPHIAGHTPQAVEHEGHYEGPV